MCLKILLWWLCWWSLAAQDSFLFLNIGSSSDLRWFREGDKALDDGVLLQQLPQGSRRTPAQATITTYPGHTFRLYNGAGQKSAFFSHQGGGINIVGMADLDVEVLGPIELKSIVLAIRRDCFGIENKASCTHTKAILPRLKIVLPDAIIDKLLVEYAPDKNAPTILSGGFLMSNDIYGPTAPDELVILNASPNRYDLHWFFGSGDIVEKSATKNVGLVEMAGSEKPSLLRVKAHPHQKFYLVQKSWQSDLFEYLGDFGLVAIKDGQIESIDEDSLKVLLGKSARECMELSELHSHWESCLHAQAKLPRTGLNLPADLISAVFKQLWSSFEHWRLCEYQNSTAPLQSREIDAADGRYKVDVLRESPMVLIVHGVLTAEECDALASQAGPVEELKMAFVNGGGHSRNRRTLSKNLYPDSDLKNPLTKATHRFFDIARRLSGFELYMEGQEPINWLYYKPGYEYRPHCDGKCGNPSIELGQRVATSLVYCTVAQQGGDTVFPNDGLKVNPLPGMMLFFTYNPDPHSLSYHSACPVTKGAKTTATQWYREGVSNEVNWDAVNRGVSPTRRVEM